MSFEQLNVKELKAAMEYFGTESDKKTGRENFIAALEQDGVTYDDYVLWQARLEEPVDPAELPVADKPAAAPEKAAYTGQTILVKMERRNPRYDSYGHTFTKDHPFVLMPEEDAQEIFDNEQGFRPATPREAQEYYS